MNPLEEERLRNQLLRKRVAELEEDSERLEDLEGLLSAHSHPDPPQRGRAMSNQQGGKS